MFYFGFFAIDQQSKFFGFLSIVSLSSMLSFSIKYYPGVLFLDFKEKAMNAVIFGHLIVIALFAYMLNKEMMLQYTQYFDAGVQFYCTIALGVALLVATSPFYKKEKAIGYVVLFTALAGISTIGYFFGSMKTAAVVVWIFYALMFVEWAGYIGSRAGWIGFLATIGITLYGSTMFFEKYGSSIITMLKLTLN